MEKWQQIREEVQRARRSRVGATPTPAATPPPEGDLSDDAFESWLDASAALADWLAERTTALGQIRPLADECRRLMDTDQGRRLAVDLEDLLDLSALYDELAETPVSIADARDQMRRAALTVIPGGATASSRRTAPPEELVYDLCADDGSVAPVRTHRDVPRVGLSAVIPFDADESRVDDSGLLVALGVADASQGAIPAMLLASASGLHDVLVDGAGLVAEQAGAEVALVKVASHAKWPTVSVGGRQLAFEAAPTDRDQLARAALQALRTDELDHIDRCLTALGGAESAAIDALAALLARLAAELLAENHVS